MQQVSSFFFYNLYNLLDTLQTGIETSVKVVGEAGKVAANQAKAAADVVASVPGKVVDIGTNLVTDGINGVQEMFIIEVSKKCYETVISLDRF